MANPADTRDNSQRTAAADSRKRKVATVTGITIALGNGDLSDAAKSDLLHRRAELYGGEKNYPAQIADLQDAGRLTESRLAVSEQRLAERDAELILLNAVAGALNQQQEIQAVYDLVGDRAREIFRNADLGIVIFDLDSAVARVPYLVEHGQRLQVDPSPIGEQGFVAQVRRTGKHLLINENMDEAGQKFDSIPIVGAVPKSALYVPIGAGDQVNGVIILQDMDHEHAFSASDVRLLTTLANSLRSALRNVHLFDRTQRLLQETEQRNAELAVINSIQQGLVAQMDMQGIYDLIGDRVREIFNAQGMMIIIFDQLRGISQTPYLFENGERYYLPDRPRHEAAKAANHVPKPQLFNTVEEWQAGGLHQIEGTAVMQSFLGVPLVLGEKTIGAISLQDEKPHAYDDADIRLLTTLANSMSIALENARLFDETQKFLHESQQRNAELAVINSVQQGLASKLDLDGIYELVGERIRDIFDAQAVMIATYDLEREIVYLKYLYEKGELFQFDGGQPFNKLTWHLIESRQTLLINQDSAEVGAEYEMGIPAGEHPLSMVFVPLITSDLVSGFISLQDIDHEHAFSDTDVRLLETLAASMSVALENARLFGETKRWAKENSALAAVGRDISATLDLPTVLERIARHARDLLDASDCAVFLPDGDGHTMEAFIALGPIAAEVKATIVQPGKGILGDVWQKAEAEMLNYASSDPRAVKIAGTEDQPDEKMMIAPLLSGDNVHGLMVVWRSVGEPFRAANLNFLVGLARQAAIAIENARLFTVAESARAAAEEANESKSIFLANVSHELRTPLTSILGFAHVLQNRLERRVIPVIPVDDRRAQRAVEQIDESLEIILSEGERLTALINNVLDLEKIEAGRMNWQMEPLDMGDVLAQAINASGSLVEQKELTLVVDVPEKLPLIVGDRDRLIQVIINLLSNAIKFTEQGVITCTIDEIGGTLQVSVRDNGIGIASEDLDGVFVKFSQVGDSLTEKPRGTGLGLPISKEIVEHHGGKIWIESQIGEGSTFAFTLPISGSSSADTVQRVSMEELLAQIKQQVADIPVEAARDTKRILVADDDASIRKLLTQELAAEGYEVYEAVDGRSALEQVKTIPLDLVVLDVLMPELSGFDLAAVIRSDPRTLGLPIMIVSVLEDKGQGYRLGVDRYLTKPIAIPTLLQEVQTLLAQGESRRRVLVIDEDAQVAETLSAALGAQGFQVSAVTSGDEGIRAAIENHPDMIVVNADLSQRHNLVQTIRFDKGLQNVLFLLFQ